MTPSDDATRQLDEFWACEADTDRAMLGAALSTDTALFAELEEYERAEVLDELFTTLRRLERFDEALDAVRRRNALGWRGAPDGRVDEAEMLLLTDDPTGCRELLEQVRIDTPEDVWLYNNAGLAYIDVGEHDLAFEWLTGGLELALKQMPPELSLLAQLHALREQTAQQLGRDADDLADRARLALASYNEQRAHDRAHADAADERSIAIKHGARNPGKPIEVVLGWFAPGEFERAVDVWPLGMNRFTDADYTAYAHALEHELRGIARAARLNPTLRLRGVARLQVDDLLAWADARGQTALAGSPSLRARYAATLAGTTAEIRWPPERNEPCWCASGRKYKKCCGAIADDLEALERITSQAQAMSELVRLRHFGPDDAFAGDGLVPRGGHATIESHTSELQSGLDELAAWIAEDELDPDNLRDERDRENVSESISATIYSTLIDASHLVGDDPARAREFVRTLVTHELCASSRFVQARVRELAAEAFSVDYPAVSLVLYEDSLAWASDHDHALDSMHLALAIQPLIDLGRLDEADARFERLLADRPADAEQILDIACDSFRHDHPDHAICWGERHLQHLLDEQPRSATRIEAALRVLDIESVAASRPADATLCQRARASVAAEEMRRSRSARY